MCIQYNIDKNGLYTISSGVNRKWTDVALRFMPFSSREYEQSPVHLENNKEPVEY